jgi:glyoxylase-like metal-dependent hydrolase (beta-lactamase superfamily II)/rhodanese-related sulfurtransferase
VDVTVVATAELGDRSYVVDHDGWAVVIDPQRDIDRWERVVAERGLRVAMVCETHRHNDYVTGGAALAKALVAAYVVPAGEAFDRRDEAVTDGQRITVGDLSVRAVETPGHTLGHVAYVVSAPGSPDAVFTGGSLLYGSVGRTDLVSSAHTDDLTRAQLRSVRRLSSELEPETLVYPTHGFGSFCAASTAEVGELSTVAEERRRNPALGDVTEDDFVATLVAGLGDYPRYYGHVGGINRGGPAAADLRVPPPLGRRELGDRLARREWVVDLRDAAAFAASHLAGSVNFPLGPSLATYLGWIVPWQAPITLLAPDVTTAAEAVRALSRIGIDRPDVAIDADPAGRAGGVHLLARSHRVTDWTGYAAAERPTLLDVRDDAERATDRIAGSVHVPIHRLLDRLDTLPRGPLWVHCKTGYRAAIAASLLARAGHDVTLVRDDLDSARALGLLEASPANA